MLRRHKTSIPNNSNANANNVVDEKKSDEPSDYQIYSFGGAVANSLLRKYYGRSGNKLSKYISIGIVRSMILSYNKTAEEEKEYNAIPKRLIFENNGGLRIIRRQFVDYTCKVLKIVTGECPNILIKYGNDFSQMLKLVETEENEGEFVNLFDKKCILNKIKEKHKAKDDEMSETYDSCLKKVLKDFNHGIFSKAVWAYVKEKRLGPERTSLRQKLSIYHNSSTRAHIPRF